MPYNSTASPPSVDPTLNTDYVPSLNAGEIIGICLGSVLGVVIAFTGCGLLVKAVFFEREQSSGVVEFNLKHVDSCPSKQRKAVHQSESILRQQAANSRLALT